jgi:hypothetical protein
LVLHCLDSQEDGSMAKTSDNITLRNTSRTVYFFHLKPEIAQKARDEKVGGIHEERPLFVLGDRDGQESEVPAEVTVPVWLWNAAKSFSEPQGAAIETWEKDNTIAVSRAA